MDNLKQIIVDHSFGSRLTYNQTFFILKKSYNQAQTKGAHLRRASQNLDHKKPNVFRA